MSGRKGQLRNPQTRERVAARVAWYRQCGFRWKEVARLLGLSVSQAKRYMSHNSGYMSHKSGGESTANQPSI